MVTSAGNSINTGNISGEVDFINPIAHEDNTIEHVGNLEDSNEAENLLSSETRSYIIINKTRCEVIPNSLLNAVNYCFKVLHSLNCEWPPESKHIYDFLNSYFFKVELQQTANYVRVNRFIAELDLKKLSLGTT